MFYVHSYIWYHPADDDHWLAAASELVYGKPGNEVVSRRDGHQPVSRAVRRRALGLFAGAGGRRRIDIVTDGDCRFDQDVGGQSWTNYPPHRMAGFEQTHPKLAWAGAGDIAFPRGHILHDYLEARVMPKIIGPVGRGEMQYAEIWKAAQRLTGRPVKFGTVTPELVAFAVQDEHYKDVPSRIMALRTRSTESSTTWRTPAVA
jgi:hypothetical protein